MMQIIDKSTRYDVTIWHHGMANLQVACPSPPTRPSPTASRRTTRSGDISVGFSAEFGGFSGSTAGVINNIPTTRQLPTTDSPLPTQNPASRAVRDSTAGFRSGAVVQAPCTVTKNRPYVELHIRPRCFRRPSVSYLGEATPWVSASKQG